MQMFLDNKFTGLAKHWAEQWYSHFDRQLSGFLTKLNIFLSYNPVIVLLGIWTKELKTMLI